MITVLSYNVYFTSAVCHKLKKTTLLRRVNVVDLKPIKYVYEKHTNLHFIINNYDMNKKAVYFFYRGHLILIINRKTQICLPHIIDCLQHGVPIGEMITLTDSDTTLILTIGHNLLLNDYYEILNITPKMFSKNKQDVFRKLGIKSMPALIAISYYLQSLKL